MRTPSHPGRAAAVAAGIVLALCLAACSDEEALEAESSPGSSVTSEPPTTDVPGGGESIDPAALEAGDPPAVDHVRGSVLHRADGGTVELQVPVEWGVTAVTARDDGFLVTDARWSDEEVGMHRLNTIGERRGSWTSTGPPIRSEDGGTAWVSLVPASSGTGPTRIHVDGRFQTLEDQTLPRLLSFADGTVTYTARVRASGGRQAERTFRTNLEDPPTVAAAPGPVRVPSPDGSHWYVLTDEGLEVGTAGRADADVTSLPASALAPRTPPVWEDASHLLVQVVDGERSALVRISPDGALERTLDWTDATAQEWAVPVG